MPHAGAFASIAVEARDLACARGGRIVFSGLTFRAAAGSLVVLRGPNGSGKSSLLRILAGLLRPEAGTLRFEGCGEDEPVTHYLGHADALKPALSLRETLRFWAALYASEGGELLEGAAGRVGLAHALDLPVGVLSAGQRRRAGLARLIVARRPLWVLDEPTAALDRDGEILLGSLVGEHLAAGGLVIAATHQDLSVPAHATLDMAGLA